MAQRAIARSALTLDELPDFPASCVCGAGRVEQ